MYRSGPRWHRLWWVLIAMVNLPVVLRHPKVAAVGAVLVAVSLVAHIALHELGHAVIGRLVGFRVVSIVTGLGPRLTGFRLGRTLIEFRPLPLGGYTELSSNHPDDDVPGARLREFATFAAGPATTLALTLWVGPRIPDDWGFALAAPAGAPEGLALGPAFVAIGWLLVVTNLLPWPTYTDGGRMLWLLRADDDSMREFSSLRGAAETLHYVARGELETALGVAEGASSNPTVIGAQAAALCGVGRFAEARDLLLELVDHPLPNGQHTLIANNLAWATVNLDRPDLLGEADHWSLRAMELAETPMASVLSTRGRVLMESGRPGEAVHLLNECLGLLGRDRGQRADVLATRSLARVDLGDALGSRRDADEADRLDRDAPIAVRARHAADRISFDVVQANTHVDADGQPVLDDALTTVEGRAMVQGAARFAAMRGVAAG